MASIKQSEQRKLHTKSGNSCAKCSAILVSEGACVGENAHIYGEKSAAARYDGTLSEDYVNSEENLIFLCATCHKIVDTNVVEYPATRLFEMKRQHEANVVKHLQEAAPKVGFDEIGTLINYLAQEYEGQKTPTDLTLLKIEEKIAKNSLADMQQYITIGLAMGHQIEDYFNRTPDTNFSTKVTAVVVTKYKELLQQGVSSIDIFMTLWEHVRGRRTEYNFETAALGILVYFFEKCEVFEK